MKTAVPPSDDSLQKSKAEEAEFIEGDPDAGLSDEEKAEADRALVRKLDRKLVPWLCLLYLASFLDRTNIGNAKIEGLPADLHMSNQKYNAW